MARAAQSSSPGIAPSALKKPFGATETLRVDPIEGLVPPGELGVVGVGEMFADDTKPSLVEIPMR
jgi:hypothetical protein